MHQSSLDERTSLWMCSDHWGISDYDGSNYQSESSISKSCVITASINPIPSYLILHKRQRHVETCCLLNKSFSHEKEKFQWQKYYPWPSHMSNETFPENDYTPVITPVLQGCWTNSALLNTCSLKNSCTQHPQASFILTQRERKNYRL